LLAEAHEEKADAIRDAKKAEAMRRDVEKLRAALEEEKAAMEKAHTFQTSKILLDVGGHKFTTSRQTLTSIPDTYLASLFSGRFELTTDADGVYFIDRDGTYFRHVLNCLRDCGRFELSSDVTSGQKKELAVELEFYGLLDHILPHYAQEVIGRALLQRACLDGTTCELQTAVAQVRALVFKMGSTTPFLNDKFQDLRFVITDRVVNSSPVWAAVDGKWFMYRDVKGDMMISKEASCAEGHAHGFIYNTLVTTDGIVAPNALPSNKWLSHAYASLEAQYASAECHSPGSIWARVLNMRITAVHGLDDGDPSMAMALRQLAALA
jgi:hypothetical protein